MGEKKVKEKYWDIYLDNKYHITSENNQFTIFRIKEIEKDGKSKLTETVLGYYSTIDGLIDGLLKRDLMITEAKTLKEIKDRVEYFGKLILDNLLGETEAKVKKKLKRRKK